MPHNRRMPANVEIKARIPSVDALLPVAQSLSDDKHLQRIHQDDTFFAVPHGRLNPVWKGPCRQLDCVACANRDLTPGAATKGDWHARFAD